MMTLGGLFLTFFTARSNFITKAFSVGKSEKSGLFRNYAAFELKLIELMKICEY